jgi:hypothetical protein
MATTDIYHICGGLKGRNAVMFLGGDVDDYVEVDAHTAARTAANDTVGTYTAWINMPNITGTFTIIGNGDANAVEFLEINVEAGLLTCRCTDATVAQFVTQADSVHFKPHRWYHIAVVQRADGAGVYMFVNGVEVSRTNDTTTDVDEWFNNLDGLDSGRIGAANKAGDDSVTNEFSGAISDVKYWNVALSDAEVLSDYQNTQVQNDNLTAHWDFVDDLVDNGSDADDGTIVGDLLLSNNYSEFTSRLRYSTGVPVVADSLVCFASGESGHAIVIQAA